MEDLIKLLYSSTETEFKQLAEALVNTGLPVDERIKLSEQRFGRQYTRTITVPAGFVLVGLPHKNKSNWVLLYGEMHTRTEKSEALLLKDVAAGVTNCDDIRIGVTVTETKWATVHTIPVNVPRGQEYDWVMGVECLS